MSKSNTVGNGSLLNKPLGKAENGLNSSKLRFDVPGQKTSSDFGVIENANLLPIHLNESIESNSSIGSIPPASLGFHYSLAELIHESTEQSDDVRDKAPSPRSISNDSHSGQQQVSLGVTCNHTTEYDASANQVKETLDKDKAGMSHVLVKFGRTYAVCYVPFKRRGSFALDDLVLCEAAHGEATGVSVADLTPYIDEVRTKQAEVLKKLQGDPLSPESNIEGGIHWPLYQKTVTSGLNCDNWLVRLPRVLRRGVNKDKKRVHFLQRRNGEALRLIQALLRERQWESVLNVAEVAYQGDFLSTTLHLHGHPNACNWQPLEYRRAGESLTGLLRTNIVEFRHSYACSEQLHITRNIVGHVLDDVFKELLCSYAVRNDALSSKRSTHGNAILPPPQGSFSLPAMLPTASMSLPVVLPLGNLALSASQASYSPATSSAGFTISGNVPCYPPPRYSAEAETSHQACHSQLKLVAPVTVLGSAPGERPESRPFIPFQGPPSALPPPFNPGYLVPLTPSTPTDATNPQTVYYMMLPQSFQATYPPLVAPKVQIPFVNTSLMTGGPSLCTSSPQLTQFTPHFDPHGLATYPPAQNLVSTPQSWVDYIPSSDQRGTVPSSLNNNTAYS